MNYRLKECPAPRIKSVRDMYKDARFAYATKTTGKVHPCEIPVEFFEKRLNNSEIVQYVKVAKPKCSQEDAQYITSKIRFLWYCCFIVNILLNKAIEEHQRGNLSGVLNAINDAKFYEEEYGFSEETPKLVAQLLEEINE